MHATEHHLSIPRLWSSFLKFAPELALLLFAVVLGLGQIFWRLKIADFDQSYGFTHLPPWGYDFRLSLQWGTALREGGLDSYLKLQNAWPPFATLFYLPLGLLKISLAYRIIVGAVILGLLACIVIGLRRFFQNREGAMQSTLLMTVLWLLVLQSFPVIFAIERGNSDSIVVALALVSLVALERDRGWTSVVMLTLATQLKMYPAILAILFLLRRRYGLFFMFGILNAAALLILGPRALLHFVNSVGGMVAASASNFNHSLFSYITWSDVSKSLGVGAPALLGVSSLLLISLWAALCFYSWWKNRAGNVLGTFPLSLGEVGIIGMSFVLMSLLPAISWDYKLLIHLVPLLLLIGAVKADTRVSDWVRIACVGVAILTGLLLLPNSGRPRTLELIANFFLYAFCAWSSIRASLLRPASLP